MTPARALALLLLASCATAPDPKPSALAAPAPSKPAPQAAPDPKPSGPPKPSVVPAVQKDPGKSNVKPVQYEDTISSHCRQVPLPANCVPPPPGEEVIFELPKPPPPQPAPIPWYRWLWPFGLAGVKDSDPEEAARRDRPPKPNKVFVDKNWQPSEPNASRYRPCFYVGGGGPGASKPEQAPPDWLRCTYKCGRYEVELNDIRSEKDEKTGKRIDPDVVCLKFLKRAEDHAWSKDEALRKQGD